MAIAGCDKQSPGPEQANVATSPANETSSDAQAQAGEIDRSHAGEAPPDAPFTAPDGKQVSIADFKGKPVLVNLWATWCAPCIAEMPTLDALATDMKGKLTVLPVSQDLDGADRVDPWFAKADYATLKPYLDPNLSLSAAYAANLPTTILYDAQGKEVWRVTGKFDWASQQAHDLIAEAKN
ncbi:TlpA family protein disulfide reductase [Stakelama marina]|uniref:TlpA family protein disulfide reductase n=1 Tax=Stakelama marina TaxID=2826939 RepID=UPI00325FC1CF